MSDLSVANVEELQKELKMYKKCEKKLRNDCVKDAPGRPRDAEFTDVVDWILKSRKRNRKTVDDVMVRNDELEKELYDLKKKYKKSIVTADEAFDSFVRLAGLAGALYLIYSAYQCK